jgi:ATP-dependent DNA helicase RecG
LADQLGSGVRNLYKYTKIYSGSEPELLEGDIFKTTILLTVTGNKGSDKLSPTEDIFLKSILPYLNEKGQIDAKTASDITGKSAARIKQLFTKLTEAGILEKFGANKNRTYQLVFCPFQITIVFSPLLRTWASTKVCCIGGYSRHGNQGREAD